MAFYLIAPENIQTILSEKRAVLIDVREREEYLEEHYGNARNCPYENIDTWMNYFPKNRAWCCTAITGAQAFWRRAGWERPGMKPTR